MPSLSFDAYLKSIQKNLQKGSERSHYPALKDLLDAPADGIDAVIEEKGNKAGIPDFTVKRRELLVGYVEAKDVGLDLDQIEKTEQLQRYLEAFPNLVLTNYLEFRWYVNGKRRQKDVLADRSGNKLQVRATDKIAALLDQFLNYTGEIISSPEDLARQMARLTKAIRLATATALEGEDKNGELHQLKPRQEDPVVHFYETFLAAYNAALRKSRGVYYTPEPVVSFIVRSVDAILKDRFDLPLGLADNAKDLGGKGQALVDLHLMKSKQLNKLITKMSGNGDNAVTEVTYNATEQRVYINKDRYFEGITPDVWAFKIGGYQVLDKWLKDRKKAKRTLSFDDVLHYQKVVVALKETMQLMQEIDQLIPGFPIE
ncbi:MAG: N-6 DNA methylase [Cyanobacteria bacterium CRU_2_1]|nr:N-6 DNA methylase [Cyanobacteria bacterium RU_5_0]NJR62005.1 N-6 DNA methylase [Cyanobacteria bacterium CRU_2_1]